MASAPVLGPSSVLATHAPQTPIDPGRRGSRLSIGGSADAGAGHNGVQTTSPQSYAGEGLLIPTDRELEELEEKWLPSLGRLRVEKEVTVSGFALYALRSWVLSRTQWSQSIITQTGKASETISAYLLVPEHGLSQKEGKHELQVATQLLAAETKAQARRTEFGTLLVTTPGQDAFLIPGGDLRYARPFLMLNTDLRRLGCAGRAFGQIGQPPPFVTPYTLDSADDRSTLRRKFLDLYKLPTPPTPPGGSWSENTLPSPTRGNDSPGRSGPNTPIHATATPGVPHPVLSDPFALMVNGLVKLIQAALYIWGMYAHPGGSFPIDGFFCDETKAGVAEWRRIMGFGEDRALHSETGNTGSCIDTRTLSALLSSVTSSRYILSALGVEQVPKDPFTHPARFLASWRSYQVTTGKSSRLNEFLSVAGIRTLAQDFAADRNRSGGDTLKLHKLVHGVASATSQMSSTLKGGEDAPLRKREYFSTSRHTHGHHSGLNLVVPDDEVGASAAPNIITFNLEAYIAGIQKSREKDWDSMGARRIAAIWSGMIGEDSGRRKSGRLPHLLKRRTMSRDMLSPQDEEGESSAGPGGIGTARNTLREVREKTGQVIRDGIHLVRLVHPLLKSDDSRRGTMYETSDSESGRNRGPRRRHQTVPTLVEPEMDEERELLADRASLSPSPSITGRRPQMPHNLSRASHLSAASRGSKRPSIVTQLSNDGSDAGLRHRDYGIDGDWGGDEAGPSRPRNRLPLSRDERALAWHDRGYDVGLLRTASDGADVTSEEGGLEWQVRNPHGTGKGQLHDTQLHEGDPKVERIRRHSMEDKSYYRHMTLRDSDHLSIDVDLCAAVLELRQREKMLAKKAEQMQILETSIFKASQDVIDASRIRRSAVSKMRAEEEGIQRDLEKAWEELPYDEDLRLTRENMTFYKSETMGDMNGALRRLKMYWDEARREMVKAAEEAKRKGAPPGTGQGQGTEGRRKENGTTGT